MGIIETIKMQERRDGLEEGIQLGVKQGAAEKCYSIVENLITSFGFSDEQAAKASAVTVAFVKKVRKELEGRHSDHS